MNKIFMSGVEETIIHETLENGLNVYLINNPNVKNFYMTFNTKFGSLDTEFKKDGDSSYTKIPNGVAHFLEHLMFNMENEDAMEHFSDLGSSANAYTSYKITCYEVYGYDRFKENLEYLLDFVQTPYFNKKLVEDEKGIIIEEVKMYDNDPGFALNMELNKAIFHNDHRRYPISGTVGDVKKTSLKDIETAYNYFYHPSNMFVIITGNFNPEEAMAIIEENQSSKKFSPPINIKRKNVTEPMKVNKEYIEADSSVETPKVGISFKIPLSNFKNLNLDDAERNIYIAMVLNSMFGRTSELRERLVSGNVITDGILIQKYATKDYYVINLLAETPYPKRYISIMKDKIKEISITEEDLIRKKRVAISNLIVSFDEIDVVNRTLQGDIISFNEITNNIYDIYTTLNYETALKVAKKITNKNMAITVIRKKEN